MYFDERRTHFLRDRLQRRLKACQIDSFYSYYRLLTSREGKQELTALLENLTVNETSFFRIRPQLELFQKDVLEEILKRKQERRDWSLRIWSAGCSTGQEPYTLAMLVCDALAYYYLRNPLPFEMPTPKPLIPAAVESGNPRLGHQLFGAAHRAAGDLHRNSDGDRGLHLAPALFRQSRRQVRRQAGAEEPGPVRLSQSEDGIPAAAQRRDFLPQRDDLFRRSRTKAT